MKNLTTTLARCAAILGLPLGVSVAGAGELPAVDLARAAEISAARCGLCHGVDGDSSSPLYPRLASQHHQYIAKQLADFKSGRRKSDTMESMAANLTLEEMLALKAKLRVELEPGFVWQCVNHLQEYGPERLPVRVTR